MPKKRKKKQEMSSTKTANMSNEVSMETLIREENPKARNKERRYRIISLGLTLTKALVFIMSERSKICNGTRSGEA